MFSQYSLFFFSLSLLFFLFALRPFLQTSMYISRRSCSFDFFLVSRTLLFFSYFFLESYLWRNEDDVFLWSQPQEIAEVTNREEILQGT